MSGVKGSLQGDMNANILADLGDDFALDVDGSGSDAGGADNADADDFLDLDAQVDESTDGEGDEDGEQTDESEEEGDAEGDTAELADEEEIEVTTSKGRETIKISYTDRAKIKRAYEQAAGADKLYGQYKFYRDDATKAREELKQERESKSEAQNDWDALEKIRVEDGLEGALEVLDDQNRPWWEIVNALSTKAQQFARMTPEQRLAAMPSAAARKLEAENRKLKQDLEAFSSKAKESEIQTQVTAIQTTMDKLFAEVSFKGRLGNPTEEEKLDSLVSTRILKGIEELEEKGVALTEEAIRIVVQEAADIIPSVIRKQARKLASAGQTEVSKAATVAAQKAAVKGVKAAKGGRVDADNINWMDPRAVADLMAGGFRAKKSAKK